MGFENELSLNDTPKIPNVPKIALIKTIINKEPMIKFSSFLLLISVIARNTSIVE